MTKKIETDVDCTIYKNCVVYKMKNKRMFIEKITNDSFMIATKILLILSNEDKKKYLEDENNRSVLVHREYSKHCIWENVIIYSKEALQCITSSLNFLDELQIDES